MQVSKECKQVNKSKEYRIMLTKSIWLEDVEVILPKRLSSPNIIYTIYLVNKGNFPITYTIMFVILKVRVKWRLFDDIPLNEITMG